MPLLERLTTAGAGSGGVVRLTGTAGMGKSRLVAEATADAVRRRFTILRGSCFALGRALPHAPLLDLLRGLTAGQSLADAARRLGPTTHALLTLLPENAPGSDGNGRAPTPDPEVG